MPGLSSLSALTWARRASLITLLLLLVFAVVGCGGGSTSTATQAAAPTVASAGRPADNASADAPPTAKPKPTATRQPPPTPTMAAKTMDGMKVVTVNDLPPEARRTIALIEKGGPFPYSRDGIVFENREGRLPPKPSGYYHEYTVETPGSSDRGARRIITGKNGEIYYTDDHYETFVRVVK
ncbi:MAG: ribonuclease domain-containing protein [Anaerolineae bacterium]